MGASLRSLISCLPSDVEYHGVDYLYVSKGASDCQFLNFRLIAPRILETERDYGATVPSCIFLYRMDGRKLAFTNECFDEVHLHHILTDPNVVFGNGSIPMLLKEARRVLREDGALIVSDTCGETMFDRDPRKRIEDAVKKAAFRVVNDNGECAAQFHEATRPSDMLRFGMDAIDAFRIVARKA